MKLQLLIALGLVTSGALCAKPHDQLSYEESRREVHVMMREVEESLFLNPYVEEELCDLSGKIVLDAGCQAASLCIRAAKEGASIFRTDSKEELLQKTTRAIAKAGVSRQVSHILAEATDLPYDSSSFDKIFSINSSSDLPSKSDDFAISVGLQEQLKELGRVLREDGTLTLVMPASYGIVFTDGTKDEEATYAHIKEVLADIENCDNQEEVKAALARLDEVNRATLVEREGRLTLVTDESALTVGEQIWRIEPEGVSLAYYHSEEEVMVALRNAQLRCDEVRRPCFYGKVKYKQFCKSLGDDEKGMGPAYVNNHPFTIFTVAKRA